MSRKLRLAYLTHSIRSDWNNGNAHFLRGLMRAMVTLGHSVQIFEPAMAWSLQNLLEEVDGSHSLSLFDIEYPELKVLSYDRDFSAEQWCQALSDIDVVILHEWTTQELAQKLLALRRTLGFSLLFHDTHHRASSSPEQIKRFGIEAFDGVIVFGNVLREIYQSKFELNRVWTMHEAADVSIFKPSKKKETRQDVVWVGNWGDGERSEEIANFLLEPAKERPDLRFTIYGVRYPTEGRAALDNAGVRYGGYLPNLKAPDVYAQSRLTVHLPRRQYATTIVGVPTIRVFEALACGVPLISAPWQDVESLCRPEDLAFVESCGQMKIEINRLLTDEAFAEDQAERGLETILARHTCDHRALELTAICYEVLR